MNSLIKFSRKNLKNAQHFSLLEAFIAVYREAGFTVAKLVALFALLVNRFAIENNYYMRARASEVIARRNAADVLRDKLYTKLYALVRVWLGSGNSIMEAAATELVKVFKLYAVNISAQIDEESGQLDNLIADLSTQANLANIETLGATWLFEQMKAAHEEVKTIRLEQGQEESERVAGALLAARKACDEAYDDLTAAIEAYAIVADDPAPYEAFIKKWNGTLKIYQDILNRKSGASTAGTANGNSGNGNENHNQGGGTNENQGGGTGDNTPSPTPTPTPDSGGDNTGTVTPTPDPDPTPGGGGQTDDGTDES
jgi:hypothetical protein